MPPMSNLSLPVVGTAFVATLLAGCGGPKTSTAPKPPPRLVTTVKVITRDEPLYLDEIGICTALETVSVQAQVSGQIVKRDFADGADVKKGDLLFTIDQRPYQAALDQAKARSTRARRNSNSTRSILPVRRICGRKTSTLRRISTRRARTSRPTRRKSNLARPPSTPPR